MLKPAWGHFKATLGPSWDHKGPSDIKMSPRRAEGGQKSPRWPKIVSTWSQDGGGGLGACTAQRGEWGGATSMLVITENQRGCDNKRCRNFSSPKALFNRALGDEKFRHLLLASSLQPASPARQTDRQTDKQTDSHTRMHIYIHR